MDNKPIQYIKGYIEFYKLRFKVTPDTLIPRPETELLVDEVLKFYTLYPNSYTLIDLGTGAGNIAISIAKNTGPNVKIIATDISDQALLVAIENAKNHKVEKHITFIKSDLLDQIDQSPDIIVTNLPYIPTQRIPYLDSSVKDYEPHLALDGGGDGFELYRQLFQQIKTLGWINTKNFKGKPQGWKAKLKIIIGEIDYTHGELAVNEAQKFFPEAEVEVKTDLAHKQRILTIAF